MLKLLIFISLFIGVGFSAQAQNKPKAKTKQATTKKASPVARGKGFVEDKRWTKKQLEAVVKNTSMTSNLSSKAQEKIVVSLQKALSSSHSRRQLRQALGRMKQYQLMVDDKLVRGKLPKDLKAVPLLESGYRNMEGKRTAGIWQFSPETARKFGLKVSENADERFEEAKETDAAIKYYKELYKKFLNWSTVLLAYNVGEGAMDEGLKKAKTTDVWVALEKGQFAKSRDYLPQMMAVIVIINNEALLK